jgi:threonylcarbamoyladenosine tRNA methylthiotransferase MtaB
VTSREHSGGEGQAPAGPEVVTFGCRLNAYESEVIRREAGAAGLGRAVIVNTCAVTAEAERQARQAIRRLRREDPRREVIVTGCAAQLNPARYRSMPEVGRVLGNEEKLRRESYLPGKDAILVADVMSVTETAGHLVEGMDGRTRGFLQVQQGCDHRCTFCIIPFARGPSRSVAEERVIAHADAMAAGGYREIVLTGVDLTAYGADLPVPSSLGRLVFRLLDEVPGILRLRLSSVDPIEVDPQLESLLTGEPRLMPHLHLSLQSGDDLVLKRMRRRHSRQQAIDLCGRLRAGRPEMVFGADLIAGFPTETDAMFDSTMRLVTECGLTYLHVFPYSPRSGTPGARMPQVPAAERRARAAALRDRGATALQAYLDSRTGRRETVLVERPGEGRTEGYARMVLPDDTSPAGAIVAATVVGRRGFDLIGRPGA